jgi:site-specific DNA-cytosine methylase/intein/homing endonuclease
MSNKLIKQKKNEGLVVLSLFDGMSCGRLALEKAKIPIDKYFASEIKDFAIEHTKKRYPDTISIGDVTKIHYDKETKTLYSNCNKKIIAQFGEVKTTLGWVEASIGDLITSLEFEGKDAWTEKDLENFKEQGFVVNGKGEVTRKTFPSLALSRYYNRGFELDDNGNVVKTFYTEPELKEYESQGFKPNKNGEMVRVAYTEEELKSFKEKGYETCLASHPSLSGEIVEWDITNATKVYEGEFDILIGGSPCFVGNTLVLTREGLKEIKNVKIGDYVLSHDGMFHKVTNVMYQGLKKIYEIKAMNFDKIETTFNHKFYVRKKNLKTEYSDKSFDEPIWLTIEDLYQMDEKGNPNYKNYYVGTAINNNSIIPTWNGIDVPVNQYISKHINTLNMEDETLWYIVGRYLGDGWLVKNRKGKYRKSINGFKICCAKNELEDLETKIGGKFNYTISEDRTTYRLQFSNVEFGNFLSLFGEKAIDKFIPGFVFDMPINLLKAMIQGYLDSDGSFIEDIDSYQITTISKKLAYGISHCINKVYHAPCGIYKANVEKTKIIEDRIVNQHDFYLLRFKETIHKQDKAFYENNYIWYPINSIKSLEKEEDVYDISVEDSHSFIANNCIVHNCQNFSMANSFQNSHQYGLAGEKSRLFNEYFRLKNEISPNYFFLENVKMRKESEKMLNEFMGVNGLHINSNTITIQHRDRIYWTNIKDFANLESLNTMENNIPQPDPAKLYLNRRTGEVASTSFQDYIIKTVPRVENILREIRFDDKKLVIDDDARTKLGLTKDEIQEICEKNKWAREELEEARKYMRKQTNDKKYSHTYSDEEFVDFIHNVLLESLVKVTPSRNKMWNDGKTAQFACKNITNEDKMSCLTRKQDRFPNSGLIAFGDYCRFVTRLEICKGQTVPYSFLQDLTYAQIQDVCGDGWTVDVIAYIFGYLKQAYEF